MTAITIPASIKPLFSPVSEQTLVRDEDGNLLGYYTPVPQATKEDYEWAKSQFTDEELERSRSSGPGRPLAEILADLKARYGS